MKRVVIASDLHSGHQVGLTHPKFERRPEDTKSRQYKYYQIRRKTYRWFKDTIDSLQPVDVALINADCIDGRGEKSGGTELLLTDRLEQVDCAVACIEDIKADKVVMSYGTPYHCGQIEDFEDLVAKGTNALKIESHGFASVEGVRFDYRHFVGNSSVPYGQFTAVAKEKLWAQLWAQRDEYPDCEVVIRSHVHKLAFCGGTDWLALTTPSLQAYWTKYGTRRMSGTVDFGLVWFDIVDKDNWTWHYKIKRLKSHQDVLHL